ncbi:acyl carrier protein [Micromonospora sp. DT201]|uniref:acyl carrier protein n=1 Tax=Micromonospora sp. DT201 TaxID=3393442 RepID=UPI003CEEE832
MTTTTSGVVLDKEELRATVADVLDMDVADIRDDAHFIDDLEADSLMTLEVIVVLEKRYGVKFVESDLSGVTTLNQAHALLTERLHRSA